VKQYAPEQVFRLVQELLQLHAVENVVKDNPAAQA
jgi:hypothetical protein